MPSGGVRLKEEKTENARRSFEVGRDRLRSTKVVT